VRTTRLPDKLRIRAARRRRSEHVTVATAFGVDARCPGLVFAGAHNRAREAISSSMKAQTTCDNNEENTTAEAASEEIETSGRAESEEEFTKKTSSESDRRKRNEETKKMSNGKTLNEVIK
jgi:chromatin remodeling complex protein RSC6